MVYEEYADKINKMKHVEKTVILTLKSLNQATDSNLFREKVMEFENALPIKLDSLRYCLEQSDLNKFQKECTEFRRMVLDLGAKGLADKIKEFEKKKNLDFFEEFQKAATPVITELYELSEEKKAA